MSIKNVTLIFSIFLMAGCISDQKNLGNLVTESRTVGGFTKIHYADTGIIKLSQSAMNSLEIKTYENLLKFIKTDVQDKVLKISLNKPFGYKLTDLDEPIRYNIEMQEINSLDLAADGKLMASSINSDDLEVILHGSGELAIGTLTADTLKMEISGRGVVTIGGRVQSQSINMSGNGTLDTENLESNVVDINLTSSGTVTVWANTSLNVTINGSGTVKYYGNAAVTQIINGTGKVIHLVNK